MPSRASVRMSRGGATWPVTCNTSAVLSMSGSAPSIWPREGGLGFALAPWSCPTEGPGVGPGGDALGWVPVERPGAGARGGAKGDCFWSTPHTSAEA